MSLSFQPVRIQVLWSTRRREGYVVQRDMVTGKVLSAFRRQRVGRRDDSAVGWQSLAEIHHNDPARIGPASEKKTCLALAKSEATRLGLEFIPARDVVDLEAVVEGPERSCLLCGEPGARGFEPLICESCRADWTRGRSAVAETVDACVDIDHLLPYFAGGGDRRKVGGALAAAIAALAGTRLGEEHTFGYSSHGAICYQKRGNDSGWQLPIRMTEAQFDAANVLIDLVYQACERANASGQSDGERFVTRLAAGQIKMADLVDPVARK